MASFDSPARWERYVPPIGNNRELERPFHLFVLAGLTKPRFEAFNEAWADAWRRLIDEGRAEREQLEGTPALDLFSTTVEGIVRFGDEPLTLGGKPIATVRELLEAYAQQAGYELLMDLGGRIRTLNSILGAAELFSARLSGGLAGTAPAPKTAAR